MPLTFLHLGPGLFLGAFSLRFFNLWALLLGSVIMDIEPAILLPINLLNKCFGCSDHGFFHSILGAIFGSSILAIVLMKFKERLSKISLQFGINQNFSFSVLFFSLLIGWLFHLFFDSLTHFDVFLFWPFHFKPFYMSKEIFWPLNLILLTLGITGLLLIYRHYKRS